jgi:hypothetical protein
LIALIMLRFEIAIFPAVALIGVNDRWAGVIHKMFVSVLVAMVGAVTFSAAAAVSLIFDSWLLNPAYLPTFVGAGIAAVLFWWAWMLLRPRAALAGMLGVSGANTSRARRVRRRVTRRAFEAAGVGAAAGAVWEQRREHRQDQQAPPEPVVRPESRPAPTVPDVDVQPERPVPAVPPLPRPAWVDDNPLHPVPTAIPSAAPMEEVA